MFKEMAGEDVTYWTTGETSQEAENLGSVDSSDRSAGLSISRTFDSGEGTRPCPTIA